MQLQIGFDVVTGASPVKKNGPVPGGTGPSSKAQYWHTLGMSLLQLSAKHLPRLNGLCHMRHNGLPPKTA